MSLRDNSGLTLRHMISRMSKFTADQEEFRTVIGHHLLPEIKSGIKLKTEVTILINL